MTTRTHSASLLLILALGVTGRANDPKHAEVPAVIAVSDLGLEHEGKEITVILKITKTQLIAGDRERKYPHVKLHHSEMKKPPYLAVYAKGELADALHRFACVAPDDRFVGRSVKATGKLTIYKDFPKGTDPTPVYLLELREWDLFQILPEENGK